MKFITALVSLALLLGHVTIDGLRCYTCSTTQDEVDQTCLTDPAKAGITNCDKEYCISVRVDYVDPKDTLQSISRSCVDKPAYINEVFEDSTYRSYFKACQTDLCNDGTGRDLEDGGFSVNGDPVIIFAPGRGSAYTLIISIPLIIVLQIMSVFCR